ncbi:MAG: SPOR domain-containing protein [Treponema sp.]|nr:SPOR domain-containing protein [Treponema sp.]
MEKKKLLLVSVSVGAFLIIVIAASYLIMQSKSAPVPPGINAQGESGYEDASVRNVPLNTVPSAGTEGENPASQPDGSGLADPLFPVQGGPSVANAVPEQPALVDPTGMVRNPDGIRGLQQPPVKSAGDSTTGQEGSRISIAPPTTAGVPEAPPVGKAASRPALESSASAKAQPRQAPVPPPAAVQSPPDVIPPVARTAPQTQTRDYFWVQAGSFTHQSKAEDLSKFLDSKGMKSIIVSTQVQGVPYFRVRIGPYISKDEADYWLPNIKGLGFEDSQVWQTTTR